MGRLGLEDFRDRSQARLSEVLFKTAQQSPAVSQIVGTVSEYAQVGPDEGSEQPGPNSSLVIRAIALRRPASVTREISRVARSERSQADGREQRCLHRAHDCDSVCRGEHLEWQTDREYLIRAQS